jgi:hypothetical protein
MLNNNPRSRCLFLLNKLEQAGGMPPASALTRVYIIQLYST